MLPNLSVIIQPIWQLFTAILFCTLPLWWLLAARPIDPLVKLLLTILANFIFIYLLEFGAYLLSLPQWLPLTVLLASLVYSLLRLFKQRTEFPWSGIGAWVALALWILGLQSWIISYGAASWYGDWYEHYERSIWFLDQQSPQQRFLLELWPLAARGPLFNAICAMLMSSGDDFAAYQVYATVLNTFPVLPLALLIRDVSRFKPFSALLWSVVICGLVPFAVQQETYTWTKFFTAGILLSAIYLYRKGLTDDHQNYVVVSFCIFATAILSHYLSVLFVIFFVSHFFYEFWKRHWNPRIIAKIFAICFLLLITWFGFIFTIFGFSGTLRSTSTFGEYGKRQAASGAEIPPWRIVFAGNMVTTTIPYSWRHDWKDTWRGVGLARRLTQRDLRMGERYYPSDQELDMQSEWFADLATNPNSLLGAIGFAGIFGLGIVALRRIWKWKEDRDVKIASPGKLFWIVFFIIGIPLNVFASRDYSAIGVAHLNLQPFLLLIAVFLLRELRNLRIVSVLLVFIFLFESALITGAWISIQHRRLPISIQENGQVTVTNKIHADAKYVSNYLYKLQTGAVYLFDKLGTLVLPFSLITTTLSVGLCAGIAIRRRAGPVSETPTLHR